MKVKKMLFILTVIFCFAVTGCSASGSGGEAITEAADTSSHVPEDTIADKNLKLETPYIFIIDGKDMDDFWSSSLPEVSIQNEWIHAADAGYSIAIFGALKDDPGQGIVDIYYVDPDKTIAYSEQILAPSRGGSLSAIDVESAKEFNVEVEDELGTVYLFNFSNGFTAYKEGRSGDWQDWER